MRYNTKGLFDGYNILPKANQYIYARRKDAIY